MKLPIQDVKLNYYALFLSIVTNKTVGQSLMAMGLAEWDYKETDKRYQNKIC